VSRSFAPRGLTEQGRAARHLEPTGPRHPAITPHAVSNLHLAISDHQCLGCTCERSTLTLGYPA
jgi:nitrate reductase cytochrome c-type subunit